MRIYDAKVNHLENPLGFRLIRTVFSWKVAESGGKSQAWARIRVAENEAFSRVVYDSGCDREANGIAYPVELALGLRRRYFWKVAVCTDIGEEAESSVQWFETAKQDEAWEGKWITCDNSIKRHPFLEKDVVPEKPVESARLYICGLGLYEAFWNGERVGEEYLTPYSNDYNEWVQYQTFDVTKQLQAGGRLSVLLGNGWYKARFGFNAKEDTGFYGNEWKLIAEIRMIYADGTEAVIGTDESWTVRRSNIPFSNLYDGEIVDDTLEPLPQEQAVLTDAPKGELTARMSLPVRVQETFEPVELLHTPAGEMVFDMGQEFTGIFTLRVHEPAGTRIHIQTGEILQQGNFYNANLRSAKSEYIYISNGEETVIKPHFTFYGYRYVKVQGVNNLRKEDFKGLALYSSLEAVGNMTTGHPLVNRFIENVRWGLQGNFVDVPTDCPQRDERMGWTGDAQVFSPTAMYLKDSYAFYTKYLYDMAREQAALDGKVPDVVPSCGVESTACVWGDAACIIPWNLYVFYGDKSILEDQFASMKAWVDYIRRVDGDNHGWRYVFHYGDWLALDNPVGGAEQVLGGTDEEFIANLYYAVSAGLVAKAAGVLGLRKEEEEYQRLSEEQFTVVKKEYYSATGRCCIKTQTALLLTLKYGLSENVELTKRQLRKLFEDNGGKLKTGFVGTPLMYNILTDNGMEDLAYGLLLNEEYPGWLYEVKLGATTVWERWNSLLADGTISGISMNSMNHYAYGAVLEWMFRHAAGINVVEEAPGGTLIRMEPLVHLELGYMEASYDAQAGKYEVRWELTDAEHVKISISVPFGCRALLKLPLAPEEIYQNRTNPMFLEVEDGVCRLRSGSYQVRYRLTKSLKQIFSTHTVIRELLKHRDMVEALKAVIDLSQIPNQYLELSVREMAAQHGGMSEEQMDSVDAILSSF